MKKSTLTIMMAASIFVGGALTAAESSAGPRQTSSTVTTTQLYSPASPESDFIFSWIHDKSPEYRPLAVAAEISVTSTAVSSALPIPASPGASPPMPLPASGTPGQTITIISTHADGGFESWSYTWKGATGGGTWALSGYEYKKGNLNIE